MRSVPPVFAVLSILAVGCSNEHEIRRIPEAPEVGIVAPEPLAVYRQGQGALPFEGIATDSFDPPSDLTVTWWVDGEELPAVVEADGRIELNLAADAMALGEHLLGLTAVDSDDLEAHTEVPWVLAAALEPPVVRVTSPEGGSTWAPGAEITFRGEATDNNTDPDDLAFAWTSSRDGALAGAISGDGQSVLFGALSPGEHVVTLTVVDADGLSAEDSVVVRVADDGEPPETTTPTDPPIVEADVGDLVFSELMVNPEVVQDEIGEWVELYNTSGGTIDLAGYTFHDLGVDTYTMGSVLVGPGEFVVLCANLDTNTNGGVPCDGFFLRALGGPGAMALGNDGDEVVLSRPDGTVIDQVLYDGTWFTPGVATGLDPTKLDAANNDDETMWCDETTVPAGMTEPGTPGLPNDPC